MNQFYLQLMLKSQFLVVILSLFLNYIHGQSPSKIYRRQYINSHRSKSTKSPWNSINLKNKHFLYKKSQNHLHYYHYYSCSDCCWSWCWPSFQIQINNRSNRIINSNKFFRWKCFYYGRISSQRWKSYLRRCRY